MKKERFSMAFQWKDYTAGVCYYPEHWPEEVWAGDLDRMLQNGITVVRVAEFAWNKCEPEEGVFTYDFWQRFLDLCSEKGMQVIFGTPTATPPAWLTEQYPEVLNCSREGIPYRHGCRRHYNYNSPVYRKLCSRIVEKIAQAYAKHPAVIGWQIDNELNCETDEFYSDADSRAFRTYLQQKFGTLEKLNEALGTVFWNQTYTDWRQIYVPRPLLHGGYNPHLMLEWRRFISESCLSFCEMQAAILRRHKKPGDFITTNGLFAGMDNHRMTRESLDTYAFDFYPNFAYALNNASPDTSLRDRWASLNLINARSVCPHFSIMEQQSGANGWVNRLEACAPRPGQLTLWAMQGIAHGADFISFFRWHTCRIGTEIYWHGILDYDNRENRKLREVKGFTEKMKKIAPVCGAAFKASFALLRDYDNEYDARFDTWHRRVLQPSHDGIFEAAARAHLPYDIIFIDQPDAAEKMAQFPVLIYPHPVIVDEKRVALLKAYVENGGTLILGCRTGYKDMQGQCPMLPQPGLFAPLTGTDVQDFTFTTFAEPDSWADMDGTALDTPIFNDIITPLPGTRVLARYQESYYKGEAALTENTVGKGKVLHFGSVFTKDNTLPILRHAGVKNLFSDICTAPETVEMVLREKEGKQYLFLLNFPNREAEITLHIPCKCLYTGDTLQGPVTLPPFGTLVLEL